jgi:peptidyl-dipeptidase A
MRFTAFLILVGIVSHVRSDVVSDFLLQYNANASKVYNNWIVKEWAYGTNITNATSIAATKAATAKLLFDQSEALKAQQVTTIPTIKDPLQRREMQKIASVSLKLSQTETDTFNTLVGNMTTIFSTATICPYTGPCNTNTRWKRDPTLTKKLATSDDYDLQKYIWNQWRTVTGDKMIPQYKQYIGLSNKGAQNAGYSDMGAEWRSAYEDPGFQSQLEHLWQQVLPLYEQLHTYVRRNLQNHYPGKFQTSAIPAHILGNMWAQEWNNIFRFTAPYPNVASVDVTEAMQKQNYTALRMFHTAESFYESIGLPGMLPSFWKLSMIVRPADGRNVDCYASAEDFYNGKDFGIKMCTKITMEDLVTIHHEMGHVEYFMAYSHQPIKFRDGANPGFHEAIGDTMALSVATPKHLNKIGLLPGYTSNNPKQDINFLYKQALEKIAFLPFGYLIDNYRWRLFDGTIPQDQMNQGWWYLRYKYQGLVPPEPRDNTHFDAGSKFHVADNVPYIRYFVSFIVQFQFHEALCKAANYTGPLHQCDIYNSTVAGHQLLQTLKLGSSHQWEYAMRMMTANKTSFMDASSLMKYFQPLMDWLKTENKKANDCYGWGFQWPWYYKNLQKPRCPKVLSKSSAMSGPSLAVTLALLVLNFFFKNN